MSEDNFPYSVPLMVKTIPSTGKIITLLPNENECGIIADFLGVQGIPALEAELEIQPWSLKGVKVTGHLHATAFLTCVTSNEVFPYSFSESIAMVFSQEGANVHNEDISIEDLLDDNEDSIIDPIINGQIDLGHIITEFLALGLPTFPRKPDLESALENEDTAQPEKEKPFAALSQLLNKK